MKEYCFHIYSNTSLLVSTQTVTIVNKKHCEDLQWLQSQIRYLITWSLRKLGETFNEN